MAKLTLFEKLWNRHLVEAETADHPALLYIDRHLVHEVTSPQAFTVLRERGLEVRRPDLTFATMDHSVPTDRDRKAYIDKQALAQVETLSKNCRDFGIPLYDLNSRDQGIVHVIGPELGWTQPGQIIVCGDSHTATHGAFGALAFGIGTSEVAHVLATQCLLQHKPKTLAVHVEGRLGRGVEAKDLALAIIASLGSGGGAGYVLEYRGEAITAMDMEARMTLCNMSIEAGARAGLIAADLTTFTYLKDCRHAPQGDEWAKAVERWQEFYSDDDAVYDHHIRIDATLLSPMVTYGTSPDQAIGIERSLPLTDIDPQTFTASLDYMKFHPGQRLEGMPVDVVFIGSCTNGRITDLRSAARILKGRKKAENLRLMIVPGSQAVKRQAESEGLDTIFMEAGAEWREPGCSMCIAMNGDQLLAGQLAVSTSNRNFAGRQGRLGRTVLASPATAAATAVLGCLTDPRVFLA